MRFLLPLILLAASTESRADDQETLRHLKEVLWPQAYRTADADLLDSILHDSFVLIDASGQWTPKEAELAQLPDFVWTNDTFHYDIRRLDIYHSNTAIVAGEGRATGTNSNGPYCLRYQSSNVLIREDGEWKAVLSHVSGVNMACDADTP